MPKLRFQTASLRLRLLADKAVCKQKMRAVGVGCVAQPRTRFWVHGRGADSLYGRERVRRLGAAHPTYAYAKQAV